jgi:hypothetical protein
LFKIATKIIYEIPTYPLPPANIAHFIIFDYFTFKISEGDPNGRDLFYVGCPNSLPASVIRFLIYQYIAIYNEIFCTEKQVSLARNIRK